jgi:hypothetical protein
MLRHDDLHTGRMLRRHKGGWRRAKQLWRRRALTGARGVDGTASSGNLHGEENGIRRSRCWWKNAAATATAFGPSCRSAGILYPHVD